MGRLIVTEFMTVDGVMEAPGFEEHRSGRNAWALRLSDDERPGATTRISSIAAEALLFGRTTYQIWAAFWPSLADDEPLGRRINEIPKYVVSSTLTRADWDEHDDPPRATSRPRSGALKDRTGGRHPRLRQRGPRRRPHRSSAWSTSTGSCSSRSSSAAGSGCSATRPTWPSPARQRTDLPVGHRAPDLRAGRRRRRRASTPRPTPGPTSRSSRCTPRRTPIASSRRCCSPTSSTRPVAPRRSATETGGGSSIGTMRSPGPRSSAGTASWSRRPATACSPRFDAPTRALRCAFALRGALAGSGLEIRAAIHTGEVEIRDDDVGGIGVHIASRALAEAGARRDHRHADGARPRDRHRPRVRVARRGRPARRAGPVGAVRGVDRLRGSLNAASAPHGWYVAVMASTEATQAEGSPPGDSAVASQVTCTASVTAG